MKQSNSREESGRATSRRCDFGCVRGNGGMTMASLLIIIPLLSSCALRLRRIFGAGALRRREQSPVLVGDCETGIDRDSLVVVGEAASQVPFGRPGDAAIVVGLSHAGVELDRGVVVSDGQVELSPAASDDAAIVVGQGHARVELNGSVVIGESAIHLPSSFP